MCKRKFYKMKGGGLGGGLDRLGPPWFEGMDSARGGGPPWPGGAALGLGEQVMSFPAAPGGHPARD